MELFEDEPLDYVRNELDGSQADSRRQSSSELIRSLMSKFETTLAGVFGGYCNNFLAVSGCQGVTNLAALCPKPHGKLEGQGYRCLPLLCYCRQSPYGTGMHGL